MQVGPICIWGNLLATELMGEPEPHPEDLVGMPGMALTHHLGAEWEGVCHVSE